MKWKTKNLSSLNWLALCLLSTASHAAIVTVTHFGDNISCAPGNCSLRGALLVANTGDTIQWASNLTYPATTTLTDTTLGLPLRIDRDLIIRGPGANKLTIDANNLSRHFSLDNVTTPNFNVEISDVTLRNGSAQGLNGTDGAGSSAGNDGESVEGGCIASGAIGRLTLHRVALHNCAVTGGNGGNGGFGANGVAPGSSGDPGGDGGRGGSARGGAIDVKGDLVLRQVSILGVNAVSGSGGNGGVGGDAFFDENEFANGGNGGNGGSAGSIDGGAVYAGGVSDWVNVTIAAATASAGNGGTGGDDGFDSNGNPSFSSGIAGDGGYVSGGVVFSNGVSKISFSTLESNEVNAGIGGVGAIPGVDGVVDGRIFFQTNNLGDGLVVQHSLLNTLVFSTAPLCQGPISTVNTRASGACASATLGGMGLLAPITSSNGIATIPLTTTSQAINGAGSCLDANNNAVTLDARSEPRPFNGACDQGSHEYDGVIFKNGFE